MDDQKDTKDILEEFACTINSLGETVRDIAQIEEEKAEAASLGLHGRMDGFLKQEQVYILKLRGLEQKRQRLADAMGWKGLTFRQILEQATEHQQKRLAPLFTHLDSEIRHLQESKDSAERMIHVRLREFEYILSDKKGGSPDETGHMAGGSSSLFHDRYV